MNMDNDFDNTKEQQGTVIRTWTYVSRAAADGFAGSACGNGESTGPGPTAELVRYTNDDGSPIEVLEFPALRKTGFVRHLFTTRAGGISEGYLGTMNLGWDRGDLDENVAENFRRSLAVIGSSGECCVCTKQTHTTNIRVATEKDAGKGVTAPRDYTDIDGLVTDVPGLVIAAFGADCVPMYLADPVRKAIGVSHSGWKGTVSRMGACAVRKMTETFGTDPADLICVIGPSICRDCYEVSDDVAGRFRDEFPDHVAEIMEVEKGTEDLPGGPKYLLDLWETNRIILTEAGVKPENITISGVCTCCEPDLLFSHRATHGVRGNNGAYLMIRP